jgi:hypothetical protein
MNYVGPNTLLTLLTLLTHIHLGQTAANTPAPGIGQRFTDECHIGLRYPCDPGLPARTTLN